MKNIKFYRGMLFMILLGVILAGCGGGGGGGPKGSGLSTLTYGGADAKGDYIAITIDASASTLTIRNYTLGWTRGPYRFSKVTDPAQNGGFQNLYRTVLFSDDPNYYAQFIIANGAAILYQVFNDKGPFGTPCFAFYRKDVPNLNVYNGTAYNWVKFQMDLDEEEGNFEVGLLPSMIMALGTAQGMIIECGSMILVILSINWGYIRHLEVIPSQQVILAIDQI